MLTRCTSQDAYELSTIIDLLRNIHRGSFFDADLAAALELAYQRLDQLVPRQECSPALVIVLSDGDVANGDEVQRILRVAANLRARKWGLHFTGTADTSRKLLVAASQGEFHWSLLKQADPAKWIDQARQAAIEAKRAASNDAMARMPERKPDPVDQKACQDQYRKEPNPLGTPSTRPAEPTRQPATLPENPGVPSAPKASPVPALFPPPTADPTTKGTMGPTLWPPVTRPAAPLWAPPPASRAAAAPASSTAPASGTDGLPRRTQPATSVIAAATTPTVPQVRAKLVGVATTRRSATMPSASAVVAERPAGAEKRRAFAAEPPQPVVPDDSARSRGRPAASDQPPLPPTAPATSATPAKTPTLPCGTTPIGNSAKAAAVPPSQQPHSARTRPGSPQQAPILPPADHARADTHPATSTQTGRPVRPTDAQATPSPCPPVPHGAKGPRASLLPAKRATASNESWGAPIFYTVCNSWFARIVILVIAGSLVAAIVILRGLAAARGWGSKVAASLQRVPRQAEVPGVLLAQVDGQSYRLGAVTSLRAIHIGARRDNVIRLRGEAVAPRHLRLFSSRQGLMLKNLAQTPVFVNGGELRPRRRVPLALPSIVKLGEKTTLELRLLRNGTPEE